MALNLVDLETVLAEIQPVLTGGWIQKIHQPQDLALTLDGFKVYQVGFQDIHVLWEGTDPETKEGTATYERAEIGDADLAWIAYIVGQTPSA